MTQSVPYHKIIPSHVAPICTCILFPRLKHQPVFILLFKVIVAYIQMSGHNACQNF